MPVHLTTNFGRSSPLKNNDSNIQSIKAKLKNFADQQELAFNRVMTIFLLERAAIRLTQNTELRDNIVFKGGFVNVRVHASPRHTTDLDAVIKGIYHSKLKTIVMESIQQDINDCVWFQYKKSQTLATQTPTGGIRLVFRGGLGEPPANPKRMQSIQIDIGSDSVIDPSPIELSTPLTIGEGSISWKVYPVELTVAEKIHALISRADNNSRSKDIFDLNILFPKCDIKKLKAALENTFSSRGTSLPTSISDYLRNIDRTVLRSGWSNATSGIKLDQDFDANFENLIEYCKKI